jgi:ATP-dependent RNA helicase DHX29
MPPNKKKKKPVSNPARGFATVSIPSKPKTTDSTTVSSAAESNAASDVEKSRPVAPSKPTATAQEGKALKDYSPEDLEKHLEEAELQLLVDKYASKCKSDSARQAAKLETERRVLRPQANILSLSDWLSPEILDQLLNLAQKEQHESDPSPGYDSNESRGPTSEEDLCVRLWTLRETLLKLGFPELKVQEVLKHILVYHSGNPVSNSKDVLWNLEESLDWLAMHCDPNELPSYLDKSPVPKGSEMTLSWLNGKSSRMIFCM